MHAHTDSDNTREAARLHVHPQAVASVGSRTLLYGLRVMLVGRPAQPLPHVSIKNFAKCAACPGRLEAGALYPATRRGRLCNAIATPLRMQAPRPRSRVS